LSHARRYHDPTFEETVSAVQGHLGCILSRHENSMDEEEYPGNVTGAIEIYYVIGTFEID
jgi:hypothetical protein